MKWAMDSRQALLFALKTKWDQRSLTVQAVPHLQLEHDSTDLIRNTRRVKKRPLAGLFLGA